MRLRTHSCINQYFNQLNVHGHYNSTGPEIWKQTKGEITHLIASSGTGGTISGVAKFLKEKKTDIKIIMSTLRFRIKKISRNKRIRFK